jgi:hypothetical protein
MIYYGFENIPFKAPRLFEGNGDGEGFDETLSQKTKCSEKMA